MTKRLGIFVKNASRETVSETLQKIQGRYLSNQKLLAKSNQLNRNALKAIRKHNDPSNGFQLKNHDVNCYVTASSISHLIDGWNYIAHASNSFLSGNSGISIHLAYYAELRAVMSLMASEGIGIFNNIHIGLQGENFDLFKEHEFTRQGSKRKRRLPTHQFSWEALKKWCNSGVKPSHNILKVFKTKGHDFSDLIVGFHPQATQLTSSKITKSWLRNWAFDVEKYKGDRELRNFVSYRPQNMADFSKKHDFRDAIEKLYEVFHVISPLGSNPFDFLDKLLLKDLFHELYSIPSIRSRGSFDDLVSNAFSHVGGAYDVSLRRMFNQTEQHLIFAEASKKEISSLPVISRATLLLRVATGSLSLLLEEANIEKSDLNFIWDKYGFDNGFWEVAKPVDQFHKLWSEVESDYSDLTTSLDGLSNSQYVIKNETQEDISKIAQFNRALLWGI